MKKFVILSSIFFAINLFAFCFAAFSLTQIDRCTADSGTYYAQVKTSGVNFCSSADDSTALFEIPNTYFVEVQGVSGNYFSVKYKNKQGYVKKDGVQLKRETPKAPYFNATLNVFDPNYLYATPSRSDAATKITQSNLLTYYGTMRGEEIQSGKSNWFYVSAVLDGKVEFGYVFETFLDKQPVFSPNTESNLTNVGEEVLNQYVTAFEGMSTGTKVILIIAISIPSVLILYFLVKPTRIMQGSKPQKRKNKHIRRHGDYFEFDEGEL